LNQTAAELRPVNDSIVKDYITLAVKNVFSTMIRKEAVLVAPNQGPSWRDDPDAVQFSSRVAFRGNINGAVTLCFPESFVKEAASVILGISTRELELQGDDMLRDVVGEIANMIAGTFKNARYQVRRLRKRMPGVPVMALFWGLSGDNSRYLDGIEATECDIVTTGLMETVQHILTFARRAGPAAYPSYEAAGE